MSLSFESQLEQSTDTRSRYTSLCCTRLYCHWWRQSASSLSFYSLYAYTVFAIVQVMSSIRAVCTMCFQIYLSSRDILITHKQVMWATLFRIWCCSMWISISLSSTTSQGKSLLMSRPSSLVTSLRRIWYRLSIRWHNRSISTACKTSHVSSLSLLINTVNSVNSLHSAQSETVTSRV